MNKKKTNPNARQKSDTQGVMNLQMDNDDPCLVHKFCKNDSGVISGTLVCHNTSKMCSFQDYSFQQQDSYPIAHLLVYQLAKMPPSRSSK